MSPSPRDLLSGKPGQALAAALKRPGERRRAAAQVTRQTTATRTRVRLMISITAQDGDYRKGLQAAAQQLSPEEALIVADLEQHGLQVPQLRDILHGGHVIIDNPDLYENWRFEKVSHLRISSHHRDSPQGPTLLRVIR